MAETLLAAFLGSKIAAAALLSSLGALRAVRDRIEIAFTHARKRTEALCDAADYATTYVNLYGGHAEELDRFLGAENRGQLTKYLNRLQKAVRDAEQLVETLEKKSRVLWLTKGESYRDALTDAANKIREATNELCQLYTGANLDVALNTNSQIAQLVKQLAEQPKTVEPAADPESEALTAKDVDPNSLQREDYRDLTVLTREAQQEFMAATSESLKRVKADTTKAMNTLGAANERAKRSKLLVTRMATRVGAHGTAVEKCLHLQRRAIPALAQSVSKAYNLVNNRTDVPARMQQLPTAQAVIVDELGAFNSAWFAAEAAVQHLGHDDPTNRAQIQTAVVEMSHACSVFEDSVHTALSDFARDPNKRKDLMQGLNSGIVALLNATVEILEFERRELLVTAHKFVYGFPTAGTPAAQLEATPVIVTESDDLDDGSLTPRTEPHDTHHEETGAEIPELEYDVQGYGGPRIHNYDHVLQTAKLHLDEFFTREGNTVRFTPQKRITQQKMQGLLIDLQMLEVFTNSWREKATQKLEEQIAKTLTGLVSVFHLSSSSRAADENALTDALRYLREMKKKVDDIHALNVNPTEPNRVDVNDEQKDEVIPSFPTGPSIF